MRQYPRRAMTLIEVMIVSALIGIMAVMAVPSYRRAIEQSRVDVAAANLRAIWAAQRLHYLEHQGFASTLAELNQGGALDDTVLESDEFFDYVIEAADLETFTVAADRINSATCTGTLFVSEAGVVTGSITTSDGTVEPGFP